MTKQQILDAYAFRHACKAFDSDKKISDDEFELILETGRLSPSSFGFEPWQFLVIQNPVLREKLLPLVCGQQQVPTASHLLITLSRRGDSMKPGSDYLTRFMQEVQKLPEEVVKMKGDFYALFHRELFQLAGDERKIADWAAKQTYLPMANMMTTAALLGIDSCPMEGFKQQEVENFLAQEIDLDLTTFGVAHITAFGYRKAEPARAKTRRAAADVVQWY